MPNLPDPPCMHCGEEPAVQPGFDPVFCSGECARLWAYEYAPQHFSWHQSDVAWYATGPDEEGEDA